MAYSPTTRLLGSITLNDGSTAYQATYGYEPGKAQDADSNWRLTLNGVPYFH